MMFKSVDNRFRDGIACEVEISNAHALNDYLVAARERVHALSAT